MLKHAPFATILLLYLIIASLFAIRTPAWQAPDEPAHYNYIRQLAAGDFPVMEAGDYDEKYKNAAVSSRFAPQYPIFDLEYEDYQPPLYYLLLTPIYRLFNGSLTALRLTSVLLGAGAITLTYLIASRIFAQQWLALTATAFVALLPQHLSILSSVNNDALAELLVAAMLFVLVRDRPDSRLQDLNIQKRLPNNTLFLSLLLGLAFLTKVTAYLMAGAVGLLLLHLYWGSWRDLIRVGLQIFVPALLIGLLWWGRNVIVYPGLDFLGTIRHDEIVVGQPTTAAWVEEFGSGFVIWSFLRTSFRSFFGQFGWMCCTLPNWTYPPLLILTVAGIGGAIWRLRLGADRYIGVLFGSLLGLNVLLLVVYNFSFVQHQGRYLFVSLVPIGVGLAAGWSVIWQPLVDKVQQAAWLLPIGIAVGFAGLNLYFLRFIAPCMSVVGCG